MEAPVTGLTPLQRDCMRVIQEMIDSTGVCPSYTEIGRELDMRSRGGIHDLVHALADRGFISLSAGRKRCLTIVRRVPMPDFSRPSLAVTTAALEAA